MDELKLLKTRVSILEKQVEKTKAELREFIEAFEEFHRHSRPLSDRRMSAYLGIDGPVSPTGSVQVEEDNDLS